MRLLYRKKNTSGERNYERRFIYCYHARAYGLVAIAFAILLLSSTILPARQLAELNFVTKILPRALAIPDLNSPSILFSSNFSSPSSPSPQKSNVICGNIQIVNSSANTSSPIAPTQTQKNDTFVCGNNTQNGKMASNSSFIPTSRFLLINKNLSINKTKSTSSSTFKNITEGPVRFQFVNSYWTDNTAPGGIDAGSSSDRTPAAPLEPVIRQEVGPGEGNSILAVVLINRGFVDVTSIRGSLQLPKGFHAVVSPNDNDPGSNSTNTTAKVPAIVTCSLIRVHLIRV